MSLKTYRFLTVTVTLIVAVFVGWAVAAGNTLIPAPVVIAGAIILCLCRRRIKETIEDERVHSIADKAAGRTINFVVILMAVVGVTLIAMSPGRSPDLEPAGFTLGYAVCVILIVYNILYFYYSRKLGGKE